MYESRLNLGLGASTDLSCGFNHREVVVASTLHPNESDRGLMTFVNGWLQCRNPQPFSENIEKTRH